MSLKKRNRRVQLTLGREDLARRHATAYLDGHRHWALMSFRDWAMVRRVRAERAEAVTCQDLRVCGHSVIVRPCFSAMRRS
jgi:hypothetical protein